MTLWWLILFFIDEFLFLGWKVLHAKNIQTPMATTASIPTP